MGNFEDNVITACDGGCRAQGETPGFFYWCRRLNYWLLFSLLGLSLAAGAEPFARAKFRPYIPEKTDYRFELGAMWEENTLYWMGAGFGRHVGICWLSQSQSCQQYWDLMGGVGGREGQTNALLVTGPRWQFVNYPDYLSSSVQLLIGAMTINDNERDERFFTYGLGYGLTVAVHEKVNLTTQVRVGGGDHIWIQAFVGASLKLDNVVEFFVDKVKLVLPGQ